MKNSNWVNNNNNNNNNTRREVEICLANIEDFVDTWIQPLEDKIQKRRGSQTATTRNNTNYTRTNRTTITRKKEWEENNSMDVLMTNKWYFTRKNVDVTKKRNLRRKIESLLIVAQKNTIRTNHIKAKIYKTQQNGRCSLCSDRGLTINHIISEYSKLPQKASKTRHDWVGEVIHWKFCQKLRFDHTKKWYMYNTESVLENDTNNLLWDFDI